jgi:hypothetical protein
MHKNIRLFCEKKERKKCCIPAPGSCVYVNVFIYFGLTSRKYCWCMHKMLFIFISFVLPLFKFPFLLLLMLPLVLLKIIKSQNNIERYVVKFFFDILAKNNVYIDYINSHDVVILHVHFDWTSTEKNKFSFQFESSIKNFVCLRHEYFRGEFHWWKYFISCSISFMCDRQGKFLMALTISSFNFHISRK